MAITVGGVATCSVFTQAVDSVEVNNRPRPSNNDITEENLRPPGEPSEATPHVIFYVLQMSYIIIGIVESNLMNDCCITYREEL